MADEINLHFRLTWAQRQFLCFLADRDKRARLNPEADAIAPHWSQFVDLKTQGAIMIEDIPGSTYKHIQLTDIGTNLVQMIRERAKRA